MTHVHFDCFSGCAGDMMTASLLDTFEDPQGTLTKLTSYLKFQIPELANEFTTVMKKVLKSDGGIEAKYLEVTSVYGEEVAEIPQTSKPQWKELNADSSLPPFGGSWKTESSVTVEVNKMTGGTVPIAHHPMDHSHSHSHSHSHNQNHNHNHDHDHNNPTRNLPVITALVKNSTLPLVIVNLAISSFTHLAIAESKTHGADSIDSVHFHEVGAVDSIVDTLSVLILLKSPLFLNASTVSCSRLPLGVGTVMTAHGELPVPAPATLRLMKTFTTCAGPKNSNGWSGELVTPTAVSLLRALISEESGWRGGAMPGMKLEKVGIGAGKREYKEFANIMRAMVGVRAQEVEQKFVTTCGGGGWSTPVPVATTPTPTPPPPPPPPPPPAACTIDKLCLLSTNLDDCTPEICSFAIEKFLETSLDAWTTPIVMKKGRPALKVEVLCKPDSIDRCLGIFFRELTTLGVRIDRGVERASITRGFKRVETQFGSVDVKYGVIGGETVFIKPEFEECKKIANECGAPLKVVIEAARLEFLKI